MTILAIAANGSAVKNGDVLLEIDPEPLNRQLAAAKNDLTVAQAAVNHVEADAKTSVQSDQLALRQGRDAAQQAEDAVKWWENVDGPRMVLQQELMLKQAQASVDDQQDELNQLKKMYKSEELTNATADIVVKRAFRSLEQSKAQLTIIQNQVEKFKAFEYPIEKQKPLDALMSARLALQQLEAAQAQAAVVRTATLVTIHAALDDAQRKVNDLQSDAEKLIVALPMPALSHTAILHRVRSRQIPGHWRWRESAAQQVLITLYNPGKLAVHVDLPEAKFAGLTPGMAATLQSEAFPGITMHGVCEASVRTPSTTGNGPPAYCEMVEIQDPLRARRAAK